MWSDCTEKMAFELGLEGEGASPANNQRQQQIRNERQMRLSCSNNRETEQGGKW